MPDSFCANPYLHLTLYALTLGGDDFDALIVDWLVEQYSVMHDKETAKTFLSNPMVFPLFIYLIDSIYNSWHLLFHHFYMSITTTSSPPLSASLVNLIVSIYDFGCLLSSLISSLHLLIYAFFYKRDDKLNILKYS